jgi:DNA repair exonuclease SbcCD ATPase subunit
MAKYNFPQIQGIKIRNFSLYKRNDVIVNINEKVARGIFCLAGANGLGKSTFQNMVNYGLTGLVLAPNENFLSPDKINSKNKDFTKIYFDGRIKAKEKKSAEVELLFTIKNKHYRIVRGFFDEDSLRELEIYELAENKKKTVIVKMNGSSEYLTKKYQTEITKDIGILKYEYFLFLQLYVFTFDENRRLLFWDDHALSNALSIAFNNNLNDTDALIKTMREMEKYESDARNDRWQAKKILDNINELTKNHKKPSISIKKNYIEICEKYDEMFNTIENLSIEYNNLLNNRNYLFSDIFNLEESSKEYFTKYSEPLSKLLNSDFLQTMIKKEECFVCGAKGNYVIKKINDNIHKECCPLCSTLITDKNKSGKDALLKKIKDIDKKIAEKKAKIIFFNDEIIEKESTRKKLEIEMKKIQQQKIKLENEYPQFLDKESDMGAYIQKLQEQFRGFDERSKEGYKKRDELKLLFKKLESKMKKTYSEAETIFVPVFKELSKKFIGYDLDIEYVSKARYMKLVIALDSTSRPESHKLSESQRFFLDIALRMSFAIYLGVTGNEGTLFIDTPEGSLDIAYENRVGKMFAHYINTYSQNILMTANINSSQLLISLAKNIMKDKMVIRRMLDWIDLSIVQKEEEKLFKKCFVNVESYLKGNKR